MVEDFDAEQTGEEALDVLGVDGVVGYVVSHGGSVDWFVSANVGVGVAFCFFGYVDHVVRRLSG